MGKMKETGTKSKGNRGLAKNDDDARSRREALMAEYAERGYAAVSGVAQGEIQETPIVDQADLEGVPFVIINKDQRDGDFGTFLVITCLKEDGEVVIFTDGGVGIKGQLDGVEITLENPKGAVKVPGGLRASHYTNRHTNTPSVTYYLAKHTRKAQATTGNSRPRAQA